MHGVEERVAVVKGQGRLVEVEAAAAVAERRPVGAEKTFRSYDPDQVLLMAPVLQEWVPEGDLAHFVSDLVETGALDLSAIYASYEDGVDPVSWTLECLGPWARAGRMSTCHELDRRIHRSSVVRRWRWSGPGRRSSRSPLSSGCLRRVARVQCLKPDPDC